MGVGAAPAALVGGIIGAIVGGWGGSSIAEYIYINNNMDVTIFFNTKRKFFWRSVN